MHTETFIKWVIAPEAKTTLAHMIAQVMVSDPAYICRDEYIDGFSSDGRRWNDDAVDALTDFFVNDPEMQDRRFIQASDAEGAFLGGAVIEAGHNGHEAWWTVEDLVVSAIARRQGVGDALIDFILTEARNADIARLMLESGMANEGAHSLFANRGFKPVSTLYARTVDRSET